MPEGAEDVAVNTPIAVILEEGESAGDIDAAPAVNGAAALAAADPEPAPAKAAVTGWRRPTSVKVGRKPPSKTSPVGPAGNT